MFNGSSASAESKHSKRECISDCIQTENDNWKTKSIAKQRVLLGVH